MSTQSGFRELCRLLAAWVNGETAAPTEDFEALYRAANRHMLSAAACAAMEAAGWMDACPEDLAERFRTASLSAVRRTLLMDAERAAILAELEARGIWYAPLKGIVVNGIYPRYGTRQFSDNDILFDAERWRDVCEIMRARGYRAVSVGRGAHDTYHKPPIYNFEMHRVLFADNGVSAFLRDFAEQCAGVPRRLVKDDGNRFGYHFGDEDFYVYFLAHAYKHYDGGGTGLRTLLDVFLYLRARPDMDQRRVAQGLDELGIAGFEAVFRALASKLFAPAREASTSGALEPAEREMLERIESSGVYGTAANRVEFRLRELQTGDGPVTARTRAKYLLRRVFPDWNWYRINAPFVYRHRWAAPFFWLYRLFRGVILNGRLNFHELVVTGEVGRLSRQPTATAGETRTFDP